VPEAEGGIPRVTDWNRATGMLRPVDQIAMLARRYMYEFGSTRDHLANVALAVRAHANRNPDAVMYERPLTRDEYMDSRWISEPLCIFDNCLESDGALAVVVTPRSGKDGPHPPAYIHAFGQGSRRGRGDDQLPLRDPPCPSWSCANVLWRIRVGPADVDVAPTACSRR
jgi:acetyl-CoA acetyltransferase